MITRRNFLQLAALLPVVPLAMRLPTLAQSAPVKLKTQPKIEQAGPGWIKVSPNGDIWLGGNFTNIPETREVVRWSGIVGWNGTSWNQSGMSASQSRPEPSAQS